jgi:hypothetical protein
MTLSEQNIALPFPTNTTLKGPYIEYRKTSLFIKYDHEDIDGTIRWAAVNFADVLACEIYESGCGYPEIGIIPSKEILFATESPWLTKIIDRLKQTERGSGKKNKFRHYQIYFDDSCAVQVIASNCDIAILTHLPTPD